MKAKLTYIEFCTLVGLFHLAEDVDKQMIALVRAIAGVTGETLDERDYGHAADAVYSPPGSNPMESAKMLLSTLGIVHETEVPDAEETEADENLPKA